MGTERVATVIPSTRLRLGRENRVLRTPILVILVERRRGSLWLGAGCISQISTRGARVRRYRFPRDVPRRIPTVSSIYHSPDNPDGSAYHVNHPPSLPFSPRHLEGPIIISDRTFEEQITLNVHLNVYTGGKPTTLGGKQELPARSAA